MECALKHLEEAATYCSRAYFISAFLWGVLEVLNLLPMS